MTPDQLVTAKEKVREWASAAGSVLDGSANDEEIAEDLIMWLDAQSWFLVSADELMGFL